LVSILLIGYLNPRSRIPEAGNSGKDYIPIMDIAPHVNIELQGHLIHNKLPCNLSSYDTAPVHPTILPPSCRALKTPQSQFSIPFSFSIPNPNSHPAPTAPKKARPMRPCTSLSNLGMVTFIWHFVRGTHSPVPPNRNKPPRSSA
jgi:hypothetical protein